jgi:hypothetical protein
MNGTLDSLGTTFYSRYYFNELANWPLSTIANFLFCPLCARSGRKKKKKKRIEVGKSCCARLRFVENVAKKSLKLAKGCQVEAKGFDSKSVCKEGQRCRHVVRFHIIIATFTLVVVFFVVDNIRRHGKQSSISNDTIDPASGRLKGLGLAYQLACGLKKSATKSTKDALEHAAFVA